MSPKLKHCSTLIITTFALVQLPSIATASDCKNGIAIAISVQGTIEEKREDLWIPVKRNDTFCAGDIVRVRENSRAIVRLIKEQTNITLAQHTTISFSEQKEKTTWLELLKGAANFISRVPQALKIKTPYVNAAIEGTEFLITTEEGQSQISVFEGHVALSNGKGKLDLKSGDTGIAKADQAPVQSLKVDQVDAVQWTMYYPPIINKPTVSKQKKAPDGDFPPTLNNDDDPKLLTYYASQFLAVGGIDQAKQNIEKALSIDRSDSNALALKSIIAIVKNDKETALKLAKQAVKNNQSAAAHIALSYAHQAHFDLDAALNAAKQATQTEPNNGIAWARVAELQLSLENLDKALSAAKKATKFNPNLAHTQTILGFSYLTKIKTGKAKKAFEKAISSDQAAPLPHLGLGLAMIREGYLEQGRIEIEAATSLDPRNSLIRSYVGKAYYEEKRNDLAAEQFSMAKQLDPNDPTPYYYDAIRKQSENNPVGAMEDLDKSIELNDNRAVYRSSLQLDQDEAARNTSLARAYQNLGFEQAAVNEASKSLSNDPRNHSAHRFLADVYANRQRHEIARVSESFQSKMLQPIGLNPVDPKAGESNLNIFSDTGLAEANINEYAPLFVQNGVRILANVGIGTNNTLTDEFVLSGLHNNFAYSFGQFSYNTDGFRDEADINHDISNTFLQYQVFKNLSIQIEYKNRRTTKGDDRQSLEPGFTPNENRSLDEKTSRFGLHYKISNSSHFLLSYIKNKRTPTLNQQLTPTLSTTTFRRDDSKDYQIQYLLNLNNFNLVAGAGSTEIDRITNSKFIQNGVIAADNTRTPQDTQDSLYTYGYLDFNKFNFTLGLSYDDIESETRNRTIDELNPKLGLLWNINSVMRLRMAAFQTLKRTLASNQTLEPTQIAGFNQFYDDINSAKIKTFGGAFDYIFTQQISSGIELLRRDLDIPDLSGASPPALIFQQQEEKNYLAYFTWIVSNNWYSKLKYNYEVVENDTGDLSDLQTKTIPISINYTNPTGIYGSLKITRINQTGIYTQPATVKASSTFNITDLVIGYKLPKKKGNISLQIKNLFDKSFLYQDSSEFNADRFNINSTYTPERTFLANITLYFN